MLKYAARHYDDQLRLKVSPLLWFAMLYGVRHWFLIAASKLMPLETSSMPWVSMQAQMILAWCSIPGLLVLLASGHRLPEAWPAMRWIWRHGKALLLLAYILVLVNFVSMHSSMLMNPDADGFSAAVVIILSDAVILYWLVSCALVSDIFAEFPDAASTSAKHISNPAVSTERLLLEKIQRAHQLALLNTVVLPGLVSGELTGEVYATAMLPKNALPQAGLKTAAIFEAQNQPLKAQHIYRELLARWADDADAWHAYGLLAYQQGLREQGLAMVEEAMRLDGKAGIYRRNACEMYRRMDRLQEAIRYGELACRLNPQDTEALHYLGLALTNAQQFESAVEKFSKVIALAPEHPQCWNNLGVALQASGKQQEAQKAYSRALKINPAHQGAQKNLQILLQQGNKTLSGVVKT
jgi:Tfp pilus assembly protein PilF